MKQSIQLLPLFVLALFTSCSNDDSEANDTGKERVKEITETLEDIAKSDEAIVNFLEAFKAASQTIAANINEDKLTVFAPKNYFSTRGASQNNLERHIVRGAIDLSTFSGDSLILFSIGDEQLIITRNIDGYIRINGISLGNNEKKKAGQSYVYVVDETLPDKDLDIRIPAQRDQFTTFLTTHYALDKAVSTPTVTYPHLSNLTLHATLWTNGYDYIKQYLHIASKLAGRDSIQLHTQWKEGGADAELAYIYTTLISYFGGVPLPTEPRQEKLPRSTPGEVMNYLTILRQNAFQTNKYAIEQLMARNHVNNKKYDHGYALVQEIINSGQFALINNLDLLLPSYHKDQTVLNPLLYKETILLAAECACQLGDLQKATEWINQLRHTLGQSDISTGTKDELMGHIRSIYQGVLNNQGYNFMLLNRWDMLQSISGATPHNSLLPIPRGEIERNPNLVQNPGY